MKNPVTASLFAESSMEQPAYGRDSMNFIEFPMSLLTERSQEGKNELVFSDTVRNQSNGELVTRRLTVVAPAKYGLPTAKDEEVLLGLLALTKQKNNFSACTVHFSRRELIRAIGWNDQGYSYQRLIESLERWTAVFFKYENAWWDNARKEWIDVSFHVLNSLRVNKPKKTLATGNVVAEWGKDAFGSFQANYLKQLDLDFFQSLETSVSKRLFRYLDKHFYHRSRLEYDLLTLAFEHVGMSRDYEPWKVKQKLSPAIAELERTGYLEPLDPKLRYLPAGKGKWKIVFVKKNEVPDTKPAQEVIVSVSPLMAKLIARGVSAKTSENLTATFPGERIGLQLEAFDWLLAKKDKRVSRSPAGYLVKAIQEDFALPMGFEPESLRRRRTEEAKRRTVEESRRRREEEERNQAEADVRRKATDAYLAGMSDEDRERFVASALADGTRFVIERYTEAVRVKNAKAAAMYLNMLIEAAIERAACSEPSSA